MLGLSASRFDVRYGMKLEKIRMSWVLAGEVMQHVAYYNLLIEIEPRDTDTHVFLLYLGPLYIGREIFAWDIVSDGGIGRTIYMYLNALTPKPMPRKVAMAILNIPARMLGTTRELHPLAVPIPQAVVSLQHWRLRRVARASAQGQIVFPLQESRQDEQ
ncbi:hypothetical protein AKJ16_DCAP14387 [Drosera capensis]